MNRIIPNIPDTLPTPNVIARIDPDTPGIILPIPIINPLSKFIINVFLYTLLERVYKSNDFYIFQKNLDPTRHFCKTFLLMEHKTIMH